MKDLERLDNREKGKLLADLFPEQMEAITDYIEQKCAYIMEHEKQIRENWDSGLVTFEFWQSLAMQVGDVVRKYRYDLYKNRNVFADQLFDQLRAVFVNDCIVKYAMQLQTDQKFRTAVALLLCSENQYKFSFNSQQF